MVELISLEINDQIDIFHSNLSNEVSQVINNLGEDNAFGIFDLALTENDKEYFSSLEITTDSEYNYYGKSENLEQEITTFIESLDNSYVDSNNTAKTIARLVKEILVGTGRESAWVALRASQPNSAFDIPRWHTDGTFYNDANNKAYKIAMTLKGASTLFYNLPNENREWFNDLTISSIVYDSDGLLDKQATFDNMLESRKIIAQSLDVKNVISAKLGQGAVFLVGCEYAAVHSEPSIHESRLFLSILPANEKQIQEWKTSNSISSINVKLP